MNLYKIAATLRKSPIISREPFQLKWDKPTVTKSTQRRHRPLAQRGSLWLGQGERWHKWDQDSWVFLNYLTQDIRWAVPWSPHEGSCAYNDEDFRGRVLSGVTECNLTAQGNEAHSRALLYTEVQLTALFLQSPCELFTRQLMEDAIPH